MSVQQSINQALGQVGQTIAIGKGIKKLDESVKQEQLKNQGVLQEEIDNQIDIVNQADKELDTLEESKSNLQDDLNTITDDLARSYRDNKGRLRVDGKFYSEKAWENGQRALLGVEKEIENKVKQNELINRRFEQVKNKVNDFNKTSKYKVSIDKTEKEKLKDMINANKGGKK